MEWFLFPLIVAGFAWVCYSTRRDICEKMYARGYNAAIKDVLERLGAANDAGASRD